MQRNAPRQGQIAPNPMFHKVKYPLPRLMYLSNSRYAFFFRNMLLCSPRFTRISGMWYLVAYGEHQIFHIYRLSGTSLLFAKQED